MAKEVNIKIKIDSLDAENGIGKLNASTKLALKTIDDLEKAQISLNNELNKAELGSENYKELAKQLN